MTTVTVVMSAYNAMPHLTESVESILEQTMSDWRMIIVDDGSTDGTAAYLEALDDPRIDVLHQTNQGQHAAAARAMSMVESPYVARMDADDISLPRRLEVQLEFLEAHPEVGLVGAQVYRMGDSGRRRFPSAFPIDHQPIYDALIHNHHAMVNPAVMFRTDLYERIGGYWEHDIAEDWDMFLRMGEIAGLANVDEPLVAYRFHAGSINGRRMREAQLHNDYACELARRRGDGRPPVSLDDYRAIHRSGKWPGSLLFAMDCRSIIEYRKAVADISDGRVMQGRARLMAAALMSPGRTFERIRRLLVDRLS